MPLSDNVPIVLLVHRNDDSLAIYQEFLAHKGFVPRAVSDGHEALSSARAVDIIITEIILDGDMDGFELISRLRRDGSTKHNLQFLLPDFADGSLRSRLLDCGFQVTACLACAFLAASLTFLHAGSSDLAWLETTPIVRAIASADYPLCSDSIESRSPSRTSTTNR